MDEGDTLGTIESKESVLLHGLIEQSHFHSLDTNLRVLCKREASILFVIAVCVSVKVN